MRHPHTTAREKPFLSRTRESLSPQWRPSATNSNENKINLKILKKAGGREWSKEGEGERKRDSVHLVNDAFFILCSCEDCPAPRVCMNFLLRFCLYSYHESVFNLLRKERNIKIFPTKSESVKTEICSSSCQRRGLMFSPDSRSKCWRKYCLDHTPPLRCLRVIFREREELKSDDPKPL